MEWLAAAGQIDDGKPRVHQRRLAKNAAARAIRPAMRERTLQRIHHLRIGWRGGRLQGKAGYATHGKVFFSEEKNQKTFISPQFSRSRPWPGSCRRRHKRIEVFWFFFSKKNFLSRFM
jgi:hypothetical protein